MNAEPGTVGAGTGAMQRAEVTGRDNIVVQAAGDHLTVNIAARAHLTLTRYLTRRVDPVPSTTWPAPLAMPEQLELLGAYAQALPLMGRDAALAELRTWLGSPRPIGARLLIGSAGVGKTRLALALCDVAVGEGWDAGFATQRELERFWAAENLSTWGWERPTLLVIDYAAAKAETLREWLVELAGNPASVQRPMRVLLLERHGDVKQGWWTDFAGRGGSDGHAVRKLLDPVEPVPVTPLARAAERRAVFAGMLARLGRPELGPAGADPAFDRKLAAVSWGGEPLFLMMAALTATRTGLRAALALSPTDAAFEIADMEMDRIKKFAVPGLAGPAAAGRRQFVAHLAAYVTLCQGLTRVDALRVIEEEKRALRRTGVGDDPDIYRDLERALPALEEGLSPVLPDVVGEALILRALAEGRAPDATTTVQRAAAWAWDRVSATVIRTVQDYGEAVRVGEVPFAWLNGLTDLYAEDELRLDTLARRLPTSTVTLRERAAALLQRAVELGRVTASAGPVGQQQVLAGRLNRLAGRLSDIGRYSEAVAAATESVNVYRGLVASQPDAFRPALAAALHTLAKRLGELGRNDEALKRSEEAVGLWRALAAANAAGFRPKLAKMLTKLAERRIESGRYGEAEVAAAEAVDLNRELERTSPGSRQVELAMALHSLATSLHALRRRPGEAHRAASEAVALLEIPAVKWPDAFQPVRAGALHTFALCHDAMGRPGDAVAASADAIHTLLPHCRVRPAIHGPLMNALLRTYIRACEQVHHAPAPEVVAQARAVLRGREHQSTG